MGSASPERSKNLNAHPATSGGQIPPSSRPQLPITGLYTALLALYYLHLTVRVIRARLRFRVALGDGTRKSVLWILRSVFRSHDPWKVLNDKDYTLHHRDPYFPLLTAIRAQQNFAEHLPLTLISLLAAEVNDCPAVVLHLLYAAILAGRILHVEAGIYTRYTVGVGRIIGTVTIALSLAVSGAWSAVGWRGREGLSRSWERLKAGRWSG